MNGAAIAFTKKAREAKTIEINTVFSLIKPSQGKNTLPGGIERSNLFSVREQALYHYIKVVIPCDSANELALLENIFIVTGYSVLSYHLVDGTLSDVPSKDRVLDFVT